MCLAYCAQTWKEALNQAEVKASSEPRRPERIIFPLALQILKQTEIAPPVPQLAKEVLLQHPPSIGQQEQGREQEI